MALDVGAAGFCGVVLAGGTAARMDGIDKAGLELHGRTLLDRTVDRIASIEADTHRVREWAGGFSDYEDARDTERAAALAEARTRAAAT